MSERPLPPGWLAPALGDVLLVCDSRRVPLNARQRAERKGDYSYYGANGVVDAIDDYLFEGPHVLLAEDGGYFDDPNRTVAYRVGGRFWVNNHAHVLRPLAGMPPGFVEVWLNAIDWMPHVSGSTRLKLTQGKMNAVPFPLPPLAEQRRISERIDALQARSAAARAALEAIPPLLERFRQSVLAAAFRGDLTREWRAKHPDAEPAAALLDRIRAERRRRWIEDYAEKARARAEQRAARAGRAWTADDDAAARAKGRAQGEAKYEAPAPVDASELPELPAGWCWVTVDEIASSLSYGTSKKSATSGLVPVLRMGNLQDGRIDWSDLKFTSDADEIEKYRLKPGTVLFNRTNSPELVGKTATYPGERIAICAGYIVAVETLPGVVPDYLTHCLNSPLGRAWCWSVKTDGVSQSNISGSKLASFAFPLCPIDEQRRIVQRVADSLAVKHSVQVLAETMMSHLDRLNQSILAKAFRGELVPQDPDDEPAAALLARIRAERSAG